jgi:hypothetical protein
MSSNCLLLEESGESLLYLFSRHIFLVGCNQPDVAERVFPSRVSRRRSGVTVTFCCDITFSLSAFATGAMIPMRRGRVMEKKSDHSPFSIPHSPFLCREDIFSSCLRIENVELKMENDVGSTNTKFPDPVCFDSKAR